MFRVPTLWYPLLDFASPDRREILELHARLHPSETVGAIVQRIRLVCHERQEVVGRLFLFRKARNNTMPGSAVDVSGRVQVEFIPLTFDRVISFTRPGNDGST